MNLFRRALAAFFILMMPMVAAHTAGPPQMTVGGASFKTPAPTVTIASGGSLSGAVNLDTYRVFAIVMPATWTAASITFQVSLDCSTYGDMFDDTGAEVTVTSPAANRYIVMSVPAIWQGAGPCLKMRSGTTAAPVVQGADRILTIVAVP